MRQKIAFIQLKQLWWQHLENKIIYLKETDSTNLQIAKFAKTGEPEGTVVWADSQTAGKGRRGRSWESVAEKNIYFSILLRPKIKTERAPMLTIVMAYSVAKALERNLGIFTQIKWPNDLILNKKKLCGILTEMSLKETEIDYVIIGVGINANATEFSQELQDKATSIYLETKKEVARKEVLQEVLKEFSIHYQRFLEQEDLAFLQEGYNQILVNKGSEVLVLEPGNEYMATAMGINEKGELLVTTKDGKEITVFAGEVSVRGIYGYV